MWSKPSPRSLVRRGNSRALPRWPWPPGRVSKVSIPLPLSAFTYFDPDKHAWVAEAGQYTILVGDSSRNLPLKATIQLPETVTVKEGL